MKRVVLSIDGGGIRGIIPALVLYAACQHDGRCLDDVSLFAGTSTGGIIATGLYAGVEPGKLVDLYATEGPPIFSRSPLQYARSGLGYFGPASKYRADALSAALSAVLRGKTLSRGCGAARLLVPTYCIQLPYPMDLDHDGVAESRSPVFFKTTDAVNSQTWDFSLVSVARATSAAPTYFPAAHIVNGEGAMFTCVDGGVFANNPAMCAYAEARHLWPADDIVVISMGTGTMVEPIAGSGDWGPPQWLPHIFTVFMDGAADTVSYQLRTVLGERFLRVDVPLQGVDPAFDDASPQNIERLKTLGWELARLAVPELLAALR